MSLAKVAKGWLGPTPWLLVRGERLSAFQALGQYAQAQINRVLKALPEMHRLRAVTTRSPGATRRAALADASRREHPQAWAELEAMAAGAGVDPDDLTLLALRGDFGAADGQGCSDLSWTDGTRALLGHNEDGDHLLAGVCCLLTLLIDADPAITTWWYPGFLPGNTFTLNEHGLVCGIDAIRVAEPGTAPGRAFVARGLQRADSFEAVLAYLRAHPAAGGFTYTFGRYGSPQLIQIEHAGSHCASATTVTGPAYLWHTNHLRQLAAALDIPSADSLRRADRLSRLPVPAAARTEDLLSVLTSPDGVRATGDAVTLCTVVADLTAGSLTLAAGAAPAVTMPADALLAGPSLQTVGDLRE